MKKYVLDASVILNFLLSEKVTVSREIAVLLRKAKSKKVTLCSSYLLPLEVGNGLRYGLADEKLADEVLEKFLNLPIEFYNFSAVHHARILRLSYGSKTSFYDASYHFLAMFLKGTFLTADAKYFRKAKQLENIELVD